MFIGGLLDVNWMFDGYRSGMDRCSLDWFDVCSVYISSICKVYIRRCSVFSGPPFLEEGRTEE